jgi:hypothetical protein
MLQDICSIPQPDSSARAASGKYIFTFYHLVIHFTTFDSWDTLVTLDISRAFQAIQERKKCSQVKKVFSREDKFF